MLIGKLKDNVIGIGVKLDQAKLEELLNNTQMHT